MGAACAEDGALVGREVAQPLGEPGVAAVAVGQHGGAARVGELDDDLAAVGLVRAAYDVAALLEAVDRAGHARRLDALGGGELADGQLAAVR